MSRSQLERRDRAKSRRANAITIRVASEIARRERRAHPLATETLAQCLAPSVTITSVGSGSCGSSVVGLPLLQLAIFTTSTRWVAA